MNKRIENLFEQALDEAVPETWTKLDMDQVKRLCDKFAELISKEGVKIFHTEMFRLDALQGREIQAQSMETAAMMLKKHFGVEE
jgi:hypothetical protein